MKYDVTCSCTTKRLKIIPDFRALLFPERKDIHYIGGSEILPAPLEAEEEAQAIRQLETEEAEKARKLLIEHNLRLVVYIAKKFDNTGVGVEDLISIGTIGLIKAINTFNPKKILSLQPTLPAVLKMKSDVSSKKQQDKAGSFYRRQL